MKHLPLFCLCALVMLHGLEGALHQAPSYGERGSDLGIQVFQQVVRAKPQENVVFSPHGVALHPRHAANWSPRTDPEADH